MQEASPSDEELGRRSVRLDPIGFVHRLSDRRSELSVRGEHTEAIRGLESGDRVQVLYWMHRLSTTDRQTLQVHPRGDRTRPRRGVFAVRSPMRPNPIGVSEVRIEEVHENGLTVSGLDAMDGSPILDIKAASGTDRARRLLESWGKMHDGIMRKLEAKFDTGDVRLLLRDAVWSAGREAAEGKREDAPHIAAEIMDIEEVFNVRGRVLEENPNRFVREVTWCPWSFFQPISCRFFAWWMEGLVFGLNSAFRYRLTQLVPEGDESCIWEVCRVET